MTFYFSFTFILFSFFSFKKKAHVIKSNKSSSDEGILRNDHYKIKMQMKIDEFISITRHSHLCIIWRIYLIFSRGLYSYFFICFLLSNWVNEKNVCMFFKSCVGLGLSNCLNAKKIQFTNNQVYSIQHIRYKVVWIAQMFFLKHSLFYFGAC